MGAADARPKARRAGVLSALAATAALAWVSVVESAPITFNTALPVGKDAYLFGGPPTANQRNQQHTGAGGGEIGDRLTPDQGNKEDRPWHRKEGAPGHDRK